MEASSVMHQVMNSHSHSHPLEEVLSCAKQTQQQIMSGQHSPTDQQQMQMQQQDASDQSKRLKPQPEQALRCPRCDSTNTKFCYYNNYSLSQPRYFCKGCRRYWTQGGTLRNVPVGGGCRKKRPSSTASSAAAAMAAKMNKIQVVASASQVDRHHSSSSPVPTPDPGASPLHLSHSAPPSSLGYDPGDLSLAFARLQQKTQQVDDNNAAAFLHLLPGGAGGCGTAAAAGGNGFLDFLRSGSGFLDGNGAFCNSYGTGFSGSGLMLGGGSGDSDSPFLPMGEVASNAATAPTPSVVKQEACSRGVLDGGDAKGIMAMMGFHHQWAPHHQQLTMQQPFYALVGGGPGNGAAVGSAAAANAAGYDAGFGSGLGASAMDYWSNLGPSVSWHGLVNSSLM